MLGIVVPFAVSAYLFIVGRLYKLTSSKEKIVYDVSETSPGERQTNHHLTFDITIWNDGQETIEPASFARLEPFRVEVPEGARVLSAVISKTVEDATDVRVSFNPGSRSANFGFDYLGKGDGFVCSVTTDAKRGDLKVRGLLKSQPFQPAQKMAFDTGTMRVFLIFLLVLACSESISTLTEVIRHLGWRSIWFWTYLPGPVLFMTSSFFITSSTLAWVTSPERRLRRRLRPSRRP